MSHTGKEGEWMKRITKIDKTEPLIPKKLRVAAYCRVSTGSDGELFGRFAIEATVKDQKRTFVLPEELYYANVFEARCYSVY